ncbi:DUF1292 domain-containing protein [[Clostridium] colinum]|uniref:DUF1292 domain-containing protein n=1 Tax=[Clostridium] colinum TaxID=36835 RepID=UPI0020259C24|nr:DUF1292 domain-containing protein [[Clostridium] colinum]
MSEKEHNCCGGEHHHEGCCGGHGHDHEEQYLKVILENDEELKCSVLSIFEVEDKEYIALLPVGDDKVLLYQYLEHSEEDFELLNIETEEEFAKVEDAFFDIFNEELFEDEEEYDYDDYDDEEDEE